MKPNKDLAVNGVDSGEGIAKHEMDEDKEIDGEGIDKLTVVSMFFLFFITYFKLYLKETWKSRVTVKGRPRQFQKSNKNCPKLTKIGAKKSILTLCSSVTLVSFST